MRVVINFIMTLIFILIYYKFPRRAILDADTAVSQPHPIKIT